MSKLNRYGLATLLWLNLIATLFVDTEWIKYLYLVIGFICYAFATHTKVKES